MERVKAILGQSKPAFWLFAGDSITHGAVHMFGARDYTELFRERVLLECGRRMDAVINTAYSGYSTRDLLAEYDLRVGRFIPTVVFLMIGMNDCCNQNVPPGEFRDNLRELCDRIAAGGGLPVLQTTCPVIVGKAPGRQEHLPAYMELIRAVAAERQLPLVDHYAEWEQDDEQRHYYLMSDPFHPNAAGHRAFAHFIFREMGIWDESSYTCRLFVP